MRPVLILLAALAIGCSSSDDATPPTDDVRNPPPAFTDVFATRLAVEDLDPKDVCPLSDSVAQRILADYGAMFVPSEDVDVPPMCVFATEAEVEAFHSRLTTETATVDGKEVMLQAEAFGALEAARADASEAGLTISPRGSFPAARDFDTTVELWTSRVEPGLEFWQQEGRLTDAEVARVVNAEPADQVATVLSFEDRGLFFSTGFDRPILASVAAPGSSQHLSLLAFDVVENADPEVRAVLAAHGWFQTVDGDPPHFTFLGVTEDELPDRGLEQVTSDGRTYWVPAI